MILNIIKKIIPRKIFKSLQPIYHFLFAWFASIVYGRPSEKLIVIGVTGTTGKTTSIYLIVKMLEGAGYKVGYTTTALFNDGKREWANDKKMTMAGRFFIQKMLRNMLRNKCQYAIVETTSEGVEQFRHRFINYDILVFTGLYPEHIESHGSFENYKKAKGKLFAHLKKCKTKYTDNKKIIIKTISSLRRTEFDRVKKTIIVNGDDEHADYFLNFWSENKISYTQGDKNFGNNVEIVKYGNIKTDKKGTSFKINDFLINLQILGDFNVVNTMKAICVGMVFNVNKKIIHVLGSCGGGRDVARRPQLGKLAGEKADFVIVTNEDPYDDDPEIIIDQVALGAERAGKKNNKDLFKILDRRAAIEKAIKLAQKGDIVLITGKGNEQYICIEYGKKIPWDDRMVVRELLKNEFN